MFNNLLRSKEIIYVYLFIIAFLAAFLSCYSPFNFREMHMDSSVYITVSDGIAKGLLPYRDLADNKGPLLYLISVPGLLLGGFTGVWVTQLIFLFISVLFAYKTALFFGGRYKALFGTFLSFLMFLAFFEVNAGAEEYSMPFFMISLYIFTKYYYSGKQEIRFFELIILGICFTCAIMIRLNMFPLWTGFCLIIFIESIVKKQFINLAKYVAGFLLGVIIAIIPIYLYLYLNGIFNDFLTQVIYGGASRGFNGIALKDFLTYFFIKVNLTYSFIPIIWGLYWIIKKFPNENCSYHYGYFLSYILTLFSFSIFPPGVHYNMALIPFTIPAFIFFIDIVHSSFSNGKTKRTILFFLIFFIMTNEAIGRNIWVLYKAKFIEDLGSHLKYTGKIIDENTLPDDKIISLGYNAYIYPFTKRKPASRYIYQSLGFDQIPGSREEFITDILTSKPAMIIKCARPDNIGQYIHEWHAEIYEMIEKEYHLIAVYSHFMLYKRN